MRHVTIWCAIAIARLRGASIEFESDGGVGGGGGPHWPEVQNYNT